MKEAGGRVMLGRGRYLRRVRERRVGEVEHGVKSGFLRLEDSTRANERGGLLRGKRTGTAGVSSRKVKRRGRPLSREYFQQRGGCGVQGQPGPKVPKVPTEGNDT